MFKVTDLRKILLFLIILFFIRVSPAQGSFSVFPITNNINDDVNPDIARDVSGNLHLVYERDGSICYRSGTPYNLSEEERISQGSLPAIAIDLEGNPHIVYVYSKNTIHYIRRKVKIWLEPEIVAPGNYADIDVDANGFAHIVYVNPWADEDKYNEIFYTNNTGGVFAKGQFLYDSYYEPELKIGNYYSNPCIKIDSAGKYHLTLIFRYWSSWPNEPDFDYILYRTNSGNGFENKSPEMPYYSADLTKNALCLDEKGKPHIVYSSNNAIYYTNASATSWCYIILGNGAQCALDFINNIAGITYNYNGTIYYLEHNEMKSGLPQQVSSGNNPDLILRTKAIVFVKNDGYDDEINLATDEPAPAPICTPVSTETQTPAPALTPSPQ